MPEPEHESAVAAWLDNEDTRREMKIISQRFPRWNEYQVTTMALMMELVVALNIYGGTISVVEAEDPGPEKPDWLGDDDEEEWRK
jgi:hypothetical protein